MFSDADARWIELQKALISQDDTGTIEVTGQDFSNCDMMYSLSGITIQRPVRFSGVTFPACKSSAGELLFNRVTFKGGVTFHNTCFPCKFLRFNHCIFEGGLTFVGCKSMPEIVFVDSCTLRGKTRLEKCSCDRLHILGENVFEGRFDIEESSLQELCVLQAECRNPWYIKNSVFGRKLDLSNCRFASWLYLDNVRIQDDPSSVPGQFSNGLGINSCTLAEGLTLRQVACGGDFVLFNTIIDGWLKFSDSALNGNVTCVSVDRGPRGECEINRLTARRPGALEPLYRYAKVAKADHGNVDAAGEFYYLERCAHDESALEDARWLAWPWSGKSKMWKWLVACAGRWLVGYGEKPLRPLAWAAGAVLTFSILFWSIGGIGSGASACSQMLSPAPEPARVSFVDSLYFSVVTFTTLGYGDLHPNPGFPRALAATEAILGVTIMPLFLVVLARKFIR